MNKSVINKQMTRDDDIRDPYLSFNSGLGTVIILVPELIHVSINRLSQDPINVLRSPHISYPHGSH